MSQPSPALSTDALARPEPEARASFLRRFSPGVAGFVFTAASSLAVDSVLRKAGIFPALGVAMTSGSYALAAAYRTALTVAGCALAARLAVARPMRTALSLGAVGFVVSLLGIGVALSKPELGPLWYPVTLALVTWPCAWLGGKLGGHR